MGDVINFPIKDRYMECTITAINGFYTEGGSAYMLVILESIVDMTRDNTTPEVKEINDCLSRAIMKIRELRCYNEIND